MINHRLDSKNWQMTEGGGIPHFSPADREKDFGPDVLKYFQAVVFRWLADRLSVANNDGNPVVLAGLIREEISEAQEADEAERPHHLVTEMGDVLFLAMSFYYGLLILDPSLKLDEYKIYAQARLTHSGSGIYDQLLSVSGDLEVGGPKSSTALSRTIELILAFQFERRHYGAPLAIIEWVANHKNNYNLPASAVSGRNPKTGENLSPEEMVAQYQHAQKALRMLRDATGRPPGGLDPRVYTQYQAHVLNYSASSEALAFLGAKLRGEVSER